MISIRIQVRAGRVAAVAAVLLLAAFMTACGSTTAKSHHHAKAKATASASASATKSAVPKRTHAPRHHRRHHARPVVSPSKPAHTAAVPAPARTGCYPMSDGGTCYEPGEFCRSSDEGVHGVAGDGKAIVCENKGGLRWEPA